MLVKLRVLSIQQSTLTGSIPLEIGNMTELKKLLFTRNYFEGQLPGTISNLMSLVVLDLSENQLGGQIVPELGNSSLLDTVSFTRNNFSGLFPSSICIGGTLRFVDARHNGFTGIHHQTFQNCTTLEHVDFTANNIVADIRGCFGEHLWQLSTIAFSQNQLHGTLLTDGGEVFPCNYTYLSLIDLSNNVLQGGLSKCFWDMPSLEFMDLSNNSFDGVVPFSSRCAETLSYLHLANNHFEGTFPLGLKECKSLVSLDLGSNNFSGSIPSWILDLSRNKLIGPVPDDFTNLTGMNQKDIYFLYNDRYIYQVQIQIIWKNMDYVYGFLIAVMAGIDLSGNSLSQEIPIGLTSLLGLRYLNLSGNHFSGRIPNDIGNLVLVESLNLSENQLSGEIPPSFAGLKSIGTLNLSCNGLWGMIPTGNQLQTLVDPSIYSNNPGLCGFPLEDCANWSTSTQSKTSQAEDREAFWVYCSVAAGFIFGFWLYWGAFMFCSETWRCVFYECVDHVQGKVTIICNSELINKTPYQHHI
uniref:Uncharacterized protein n=1 Tax=Avena sativa TaxID=4498 RepID=A0ACD5WLG2_AVESA